MRIQKTVLFLLVFLIGFASNSQDCIPEKPNPPRLVNDFAGLLSPQEEQQLEKKLVDFNDTTSTQIAIVTVNDLCEYDAASFTFQLGEKWGVGDANFNNGLVMMIKPKVGNSRGQAFIATGYGLEGVLPDAIAKRIIENELIPQFKKNNIFGGIAAGTNVIVEIVGGEYSAENYNNQNGKQKKFPIFPLFFILLFVIIMFAGTFRRAKSYSTQNNVGLWAALLLMGSMNQRHGGHYNHFRSGSGGFGGGSGGGFGGFGGGSFGGGGAGGSW